MKSVTRLKEKILFKNQQNWTIVDRTRAILMSKTSIFCPNLQYKHCCMLWRKPCGLSCNIFINPPVIYKRFKLRKKDLFRYGIFHIFAKINSPYAKMGGSPLYSIFELQRIKILEPFQNFPYVKLLCCLHWWSYFD